MKKGQSCFSSGLFQFLLLVVRLFHSIRVFGTVLYSCVCQSILFWSPNSSPILCEAKNIYQFVIIRILQFLVFHFTYLKMDLGDAARNGHLESVRLLVEQGSDINMLGRSHSTPLHLASWMGHLDVVQYLVEQGAAIDKTTADHNRSYTPLSGAAYAGYLEITRYLLEQGADRDKADGDGETPLHDAAREGHLEIAMLLMSYGTDLNARNKYGELPIDVAVTDEIKQAIRDEPRRRMDHGHKRATEQDRHPNAAASASAQQEDDEEEEEQQSNKRPRLNEGEVAEEETKVAEEDEDSEPSSDEEVDD